MHMYKTVGQEMRNKADADLRNFMLNSARAEAKADAAVSFSTLTVWRLMRRLIISHVEIIELLRQESEKFDHEGRAHKQELKHG